MKKLTTTLLMAVVVSLAAVAQPTARLQVIHNAADPAADTVDVYVNGVLTFDDFAFRTATPFDDVPAGAALNVGVAPGNSTSAADTIADFPIGALTAGETYVLIANGVLAPGSFTANPDAEPIAFNLYPFAPAQEAGTNGATNVDFLAFHGATDAPGVDVVARGVGPLVSNIVYGNYSGSSYSTAPEGAYYLDVNVAGTQNTAATFYADLNGLGGGAAVIFASGFLDVAQGPAFGLFAALPNGTVVEFPKATGTARVQVIHNSPDSLVNTVDVYVNDAELSALDDFTFRSATPYVDIPTGIPTQVKLAASASTGVNDLILATVDFGNALQDGETYAILASGLADTSAYASQNPDGVSRAFSLLAYSSAETATTGSNTDLLIAHGSPDAPSVDVVARNVGTIGDNLTYQDGALVSVPADTYIIDITDSTGATTVKSYYAPISTAAGFGAVVFASGFFNPGQGAPFQVWVALPNGTTFPLTEIQEANVQVIHNSADLAADTVDVYVLDDIGDVIATLDDVAFRTNTDFLQLPSNVPLSVAVAPSNSSSAADSLLQIDIGSLMTDSNYIVIANGIVSGSGYSPAPAFGLDIYASARQQAANQGATEVDVLVYHGSTDAPTVDIYETSAGELIDDISYGEFNPNGYITLPESDYSIEVRDAAGTTTLLTYSAPLEGLDLEDQAITVLASGFLDPSVNSSGPGFGLYAALSTQGELVPLPLITSTGEAEVELVNDVQIFPNPASEFIRVNYTLENAARVQYNLYDVNGKVVRSVDAGTIAAGTNNLNIDVNNLTSGNYFLQMNIGENTSVSQTVMIK